MSDRNSVIKVDNLEGMNILAVLVGEDMEALVGVGDQCAQTIVHGQTAVAHLIQHSGEDDAVGYGLVLKEINLPAHQPHESAG